MERRRTVPFLPSPLASEPPSLHRRLTPGWRPDRARSLTSLLRPSAPLPPDRSPRPASHTLQPPLARAGEARRASRGGTSSQLLHARAHAESLCAGPRPTRLGRARKRRSTSRLELDLPRLEPPWCPTGPERARRLCRSAVRPNDELQRHERRTRAAKSDGREPEPVVRLTGGRDQQRPLARPSVDRSKWHDVEHRWSVSGWARTRRATRTGGTSRAKGEMVRLQISRGGVSARDAVSRVLLSETGRERERGRRTQQRERPERCMVRERLVKACRTSCSQSRAPLGLSARRP